MSVVSDRHLFTEFKSGESKAFDGQRLAKVSYKAKSGKKSQCVSVPKLTDGECESINAAYPVEIRARVEKFQDDLIKALFESGKSEVSSAEIDKSQILAYLEAATNESRLSGEVVRKWWADFQSTALPVLSEKYGTNDEAELTKKANAWRDAFVALTGKNPITAERITQLQSMLEYADEEDSIAQRLGAKLDLLVEELETMNNL